MFIELEDVAPHLLGLFMIALACVPLLFVWQDRRRRLSRRDRQEDPVPLPAATGARLAGGR